jgi:1,4-alpha-glucan branching enzyme
MLDCDWSSDVCSSDLAWERHAPGEPPVAIISNMTPVPRDGYGLKLSRGGRWREILNSDASDYGGSNMGNNGYISAADDGYASLTLPPLATIILEAA